MIRGKTAALFAAACEVGARRGRAARGRGAGRSPTYGTNLGIAFQLVDDALDYAADQATLGKTVGDDFREGKITLPVLAAYDAGDEAEREFWRRTIEASDQERRRPRPGHAPDGARGAIQATLDPAAAFASVPRQPCPASPTPTCRRSLFAVADYTVSRARAAATTHRQGLFAA